MDIHEMTALSHRFNRGVRIGVKVGLAIAGSLLLVLAALSAEANDRSEEIKSALEIGHRVSALRLALAWIRDDPGSADAAETAAFVAKKCRRMEKEERIPQIVNLWLEAQQRTDFLSSAARVCENVGLEETALELYGRRLELDPNDSEARRGMARVFAKANKLDVAYQELQSHLNRNPNDAAAYLDAARIDLMMGNPKAAIQAAEKVIASRQRSGDSEAPGSRRIAEAHLLLADACVALADAAAVKRAVSEYRMALALTPDSADAHYGLANALDRLGKPKDAKTEWDRFLALENDTPRAGKAVYRKHRAYFEKEEWRNKWRITNDSIGGNSWWIAEPKQPERPTGGNDPNPGRKGILRMHPLGGDAPIELARRVHLKPEGGFLCIGVSGRYWKWNCDSVMRVIVNGDIIAEEIINSGDAPSPENWYDFCYDLSDYAGGAVEIKVQTAAGGKNPWWGEEQFFDYIEILDRL